MSRIVTVVVTIAIWATVVLRPTFGQIFRNHTNAAQGGPKPRIVAQSQHNFLHL